MSRLGTDKSTSIPILLGRQGTAGQPGAEPRAGDGVVITAGRGADAVAGGLPEQAGEDPRRRLEVSEMRGVFDSSGRGAVLTMSGPKPVSAALCPFL